MSISRSSAPRDDAAAVAWMDYQSIIAGAARSSDGPSVTFAVSTDDPAEGKGDLYVALGLARALRLRGWSVSLWPSRDWREPAPACDVLVAMLESFVPGTVRPETALVAWVRNWTRRWAELPFLDTYDLVFASSTSSAEELRRRYSGDIRLLPIAVDADLFSGHPQSARPTQITTTINFWGVQREIQQFLPELAVKHPIAWYGANGDRAAVPDGIDYRGPVEFNVLPEVYRSTQIVLDDLIEPAKAFDNQNSRLFESLASGALPITNANAEALAELGLERVPTYVGGDELVAEVDSLLADSAARVLRASQLQQVVLERHTYRARADDFVEAWSELSTRPRTERPAWLAWASGVREALRETADVLDRTQRAIESEKRAAQAEHADRERLEKEFTAVRKRLTTLESSWAYRVLARFRRLLPRR